MQHCDHGPAGLQASVSHLLSMTGQQMDIFGRFLSLSPMNINRLRAARDVSHPGGFNE